MYVLMARLAQSDAVRHIVAEDGVLLPRLDVMRLYSASASTLLAGVIVSFVDGITPLLVLVRITLFVCILLALGCVAAILAAIFRLQMAVGWMERIAAPMARNKRLWSIEGVALFCAFARAKSTVAPYVAEWLAAHGANGRKAFIAFPGVLIVGNECLSALSASALRRLEQWRFVIPHSLHYTPACEILQALERWATHTGKTRRGLASGKLGGASSVAADDEGAAVVQSSAPSSRASNPDLGKCRVCHRPLTDPASAASGIGPCCAAKLAAGGGDDLAVGGDLLAAVHLHLTALVDALPALRTEFRHDPTGIGLVAKLQAAVVPAAQYVGAKMTAEG